MRCILIATLFFYVSSKNLPPEIQKCSLSDPNLPRCLEKTIPKAAKTFADGNEDLGMTPTDPFFVQKIEVGNTTVHQVYENMKFHGILDSTMSDTVVDFSDDHCSWSFNMFTKHFFIEGNYKMTGQLLMFPLNGHGKATLTLRNVHSKFNIKCENYMKKNKKHIRFVEIKCDMQPEEMEGDLENIIDGNEALSKEVIKTLNENSKTLWAEMWPFIGATMEKVWKETVNRFFAKVSQDELFLP